MTHWSLGNCGHGVCGCLETHLCLLRGQVLAPSARGSAAQCSSLWRHGWPLWSGDPPRGLQLLGVTSRLGCGRAWGMLLSRRFLSKMGRRVPSFWTWLVSLVVVRSVGSEAVPETQFVPETGWLRACASASCSPAWHSRLVQGHTAAALRATWHMRCWMERPADPFGRVTVRRWVMPTRSQLSLSFINNPQQNCLQFR